MSDVVWSGPEVVSRSPELRLGRMLALRVLYAMDLNKSPLPHREWRTCMAHFFDEEHAPFQAQEAYDEAVAIARADAEADGVDLEEQPLKLPSPPPAPDPDLVWSHRQLADDANWQQARALGLHWTESIEDMRGKLDAVIRASSKRWRVSRMQPIERNILRVGVFELLSGVVPPRDVIFDCVELAKRFGDTRSPRFVNGILDQVCQDNAIAL